MSLLFVMLLYYNNICNIHNIYIFYIHIIMLCLNNDLNEIAIYSSNNVLFFLCLNVIFLYNEKKIFLLYMFVLFCFNIYSQIINKSLLKLI